MNPKSQRAGDGEAERREPDDPAPPRAAEFIGARVVRVPLRPDGAHDVEARQAATRKTPTGLLYVCNPNNPTGTITPRPAIECLYESRPPGSVMLLDEAYIHFCDEPPGVDFVRRGADVVVLRTFSKIYGMAWLDAQGFSYMPSVSSKLMVDARMPTQKVIEAMAARGVYIGRPWPVWPTWVRISLGSAEDMARFKTAFAQVTAGA